MLFLRFYFLGDSVGQVTDSQCVMVGPVVAEDSPEVAGDCKTNKIGIFKFGLFFSEAILAEIAGDVKKIHLKPGIYERDVRQSRFSGWLPASQPDSGAILTAGMPGYGRR